VAVALGYVDVAVGTETSGSIVCPASVNGVVGFKPTHGLVEGTGVVPLAGTQDTAGPIANSVRLAAKTLAVMSSNSAKNSTDIRRGLLSLDAVESLRGLRIGIFASTRGYDPRRDSELDAVLQTLEARGVTLIPGLTIDRYDGYGQDAYDVLLYEFRRDLNAYLAALPNTLNTLDLAAIIKFNKDHAQDELRYFDQSILLESQALGDSEETYAQKRKTTQTAMREQGLDRLFAEHQLDAIIGITEGPAWMIDWVNGDADFGNAMAGPPAVAGNPHITLPLGKVAGLPLGISLIGERWLDHKLAAIALQLEEAHPSP
jgi:amidase